MIRNIVSRMSNESRFVSESLEALLMSIADGVREAQDALSNTPSVDAFGRPMTTYHLPHLDFKIDVNMETISDGRNRGGLCLRVLKNSHNSSTRDISSTLSGRLVAIPPSEGLPRTILTISSKDIEVAHSGPLYRIVIRAMNSAGEILVGQAIELNINREATIQLSKVSLGDLKTDYGRLDDVILITNTEGIAETNFSFGGDRKMIYVLTAELGNESISLSIHSQGVRR